jgi:hypothetical protein
MSRLKSPSDPNAWLMCAKLFLAGVAEVVPDKATLMIGGEATTKKELLQKLGELIVPYQQAVDAEAAYRYAIATRDSQQESSKNYLDEARLVVLAFLGSKNPQLGKCGLSPEKPKTKLTSDQLAERTEKLRQTRQLRHTLGPKQKANIKAGSAPVSVPPQQPSGGNTASSPAPSAPSGTSQATGTNGSTNGAPSP